MTSVSTNTSVITDINNGFNLYSFASLLAFYMMAVFTLTVMSNIINLVKPKFILCQTFT